MTPVRKRLEELKADRKYLEEVALKGAQKAEKVAKAKLKQVYKKLGLVVRD